MFTYHSFFAAPPILLVQNVCNDSAAVDNEGQDKYRRDILKYPPSPSSHVDLKNRVVRA